MLYMTFISLCLGKKEKKNHKTYPIQLLQYFPIHMKAQLQPNALLNYKKNLSPLSFTLPFLLCWSIFSFMCVSLATHQTNNKITITNCKKCWITDEFVELEDPKKRNRWICWATVVNLETEDCWATIVDSSYFRFRFSVSSLNLELLFLVFCLAITCLAGFVPLLTDRRKEFQGKKKKKKLKMKKNKYYFNDIGID